MKPNSKMLKNSLLVFILALSLIFPPQAFAGRSHVGGGEDIEIDWSDIGDDLALSIGVSFASAWASSAFNSAWNAANTTTDITTGINTSIVTGSGLAGAITQPYKTACVTASALWNLASNPLKYAWQGLESMNNISRIASIAITGFSTYTAATQVARAVGAYGNYYDWNPRKIYTISGLMVGATGGLINPNAYLSPNNGFQPIPGALVGGFSSWANAATVAAIDGSKINDRKDPGIGAQIAGYTAGLFATELGRTTFDPATYANNMQEIHPYKAPDEIYKLQYDDATGTSTFKNGAGEIKTFEELCNMGGTFNTDGDMVITHDPQLVRYDFSGSKDTQTYRQGQNDTWVSESDPNKVFSKQEWEALQKDSSLRVTTKKDIAILTHGKPVPVASEAEIQKMMARIGDKTRFDPRAGAQQEIYESAYHYDSSYINKEGDILSSGEFYNRFAGKPDSIQVTPNSDGSMTVTRAVSPEASWRSSAALVRRSDTIITPTQDGNYQVELFSESKNPIVVDEVSGRSLYFAKYVKSGFGVNEGRSTWVPAEVFSSSYRPSASTVLWRLGAGPLINTANLWPQILTKYLVLAASREFEEHNKDNWAAKWKPLIEASIQSTVGPLLDTSANILGWKLDFDRQLQYYPAMEAYRSQIFGQALAKRTWKQLEQRPKEIFKQVDIFGVPGYVDADGNMLSTQDVEMLNYLYPGTYSVEKNGDLHIYKDPIPDSLTGGLASDRQIEFTPLRTPDGKISTYIDSSGRVYSPGEIMAYMSDEFPNLYFDKNGAVYSLHSPDDAFYNALQNRGLTSEKEQVKVLSDAIVRKTRMETASEWSAYKNLGGSKWEAFSLAAGNTLRTDLPIALIASAIEIGIDDSTSSDKEDFSHALTASLRNIAITSTVRGLVWGLYGDALHGKQLSNIGKAEIPNEIFPYNLPEDEATAARAQGYLEQPGERVTIGEMGFYHKDKDSTPFSDEEMSELQRRIDKSYAAYGAQAPDIRTTDLNTIKEGLEKARAANRIQMEFGPEGTLILSEFNDDFGKYVKVAEYQQDSEGYWLQMSGIKGTSTISPKELEQIKAWEASKETLNYLNTGIGGQGVTRVRPDIEGNFRLASNVAMSGDFNSKGYALQRNTYRKPPLMPNTIWAGKDGNNNIIYMDDPEFELKTRRIIAFTIKNGEIGISDESTIFKKKYELIPTAGVVPSIVGSFGQSASELVWQTIAMGLTPTPGGKMSTLALVNYNDKLRQLASAGASGGLFKTMGEYMTATGVATNFGVAKDLITRNILTTMADIPYVGDALGLAPYVPVAGYKGMPFSVAANVGGGYGEMRTRYYPYWPYDRINIVPYDTFWRGIKISQSERTSGQVILPPAEQPEVKAGNNND